MKKRYGYKVYVNYILWKLGIRDILPREIIKQVIEKENNDPLINISKDNSLFFFRFLKKDRENFITQKSLRNA